MSRPAASIPPAVPPLELESDTERKSQIGALRLGRWFGRASEFVSIVKVALSIYN